MGVPVINRISDYNPVCGAASLYHEGKFCDACFADADRSLLKKDCVKGSKLFSMMRYFPSNSRKCWRWIGKSADMSVLMVLWKRWWRDVVMIRENFRSYLPFPWEAWICSCWQGHAFRFWYTATFIYWKHWWIERYLRLGRSNGNIETPYFGFPSEHCGRLAWRGEPAYAWIIGSKKLTGHVTFEPFRSDGRVFEYYLDNHVTVLPARWSENLPNTLIESLYFHRPVIVPQWGSFKYTTDLSVAFIIRHCRSSL